MERKKLKIALVGNPNSGKTTFFNAITGLHQKVANFPGVTVEKKTGYYSSKDLNLEITDLPGTYSLYGKSPDEKIPFQILCDPGNPSYPDLTLVIADASNLKRSLLICTQIIDLNRPVVLLLNMMDLVKARGIKIDIKGLSSELGIPVLPIHARKKEGLDEVKEFLKKPVFPPLQPFLETGYFTQPLTEEIRKSLHLSSDYAAFQMAGSVSGLENLSFDQHSLSRLHELVSSGKNELKTIQAKETLARYNKIGAILDRNLIHTDSAKKQFTNTLDRILTHRIFGFVFFLLIMLLMFQAVFSWSQYPMNLVESGFQQLGNMLETSLPPGWSKDLLINGILAGLSGVIVFVPQIAILFTFIAILEDSGYMARVSFISDRLMRKFGLNGKSVIPLISGVACAVPAIMSTRTIQNRKERFLTILVTPFMSCSARIPVYTLLISLVIPNKMIWGFVSLQGLTLMGLYLLGAFTALGSALILKLFIKSRERSFFIMEMPIYRIPRWNNMGLMILEKVKVFVFDAGKVILAISVILWALASYSPPSTQKALDEKYSQYKTQVSSFQHDDNHKDLDYKSEKLGNSYAGILGRTLEPVIQPLGFNWKIGIALVTSFAAREVFVGTMATIYSANEDIHLNRSLKSRMSEEKNPDGTPFYSLAVGLSLMIFYAFAMQCMSTVSVVKRETGGWKWPLIQILFMSGLAWIASFVTFQLLK